VLSSIRKCGVVTLKKQEPLKNEMVDFLDAIEKKRRPRVNGEDGIEALRTADEPQLVCGEEDRETMAVRSSGSPRRRWSR
jgi:predicted dehydrogenase